MGLPPIISILCLLGQISFRSNVHVSMIFGHSSFRRDVLLVRCLSAKCPFGHLSFGYMSFRSFVFRRYVRSVICLSTICPTTYVQTSRAALRQGCKCRSISDPAVSRGWTLSLPVSCIAGDQLVVVQLRENRLLHFNKTMNHWGLSDYPQQLFFLVLNIHTHVNCAFVSRRTKKLKNVHKHELPQK